MGMPVGMRGISELRPSANIGLALARLCPVNRLMATGAAALAVGGGVCATATAQEGAEFRTPGEAAYCNAYSGDLICWTPNDGFTVWMSNTGRAHKKYRKDHRGYEDNRAPVLRFGKSKRWGGYVCKSRSTGLTCANRRGHGWWLGRYVGYRVF